MNCPECGASESACADRFDEFLVLEFTDAGYGAVHHLTVPAYMLQHSSKLTKEGWLHMRELLKEFLIENKPPAFIRKQNKDLGSCMKNVQNCVAERRVLARRSSLSHCQGDCFAAKNAARNDTHTFNR